MAENSYKDRILLNLPARKYGGVTAPQLAARMGCTVAAVSKCLKRLENLNLVGKYREVGRAFYWFKNEATCKKKN